MGFKLLINCTWLNNYVASFVYERGKMYRDKVFFYNSTEFSDLPVKNPINESFLYDCLFTYK